MMPKTIEAVQQVLSATTEALAFGVLESRVRGLNCFPRLVDKPDHDEILRAVNTLHKQGSISVLKGGKSSYQWVIFTKEG
jgi:hypothetical protein